MVDIDVARKRPSPERRVRKLTRNRDIALSALEALDDHSIRELVRRTEEMAGLDGYGQGGERGTGKPNAPEDAPVTGAALGGLSEDRPDDWTRHRVIDPVGDAVAAIDEAMSEIVSCLRRVEGDARRVARLSDYVANHRDEEPRRASSLQGTCLACEESVSGARDDRLVRGLCHRCYLSWSAWKLEHELRGDPGERFIHYVAWRRERLAEELAEAQRVHYEEER